MSPRWTATAPLPGGDFAWDRFDAEVDAARERWRFLSEAQARPPGRRLWLAARSRAGRRPRAAPISARPLGPELTGAEVRYLMAREWARFPDDILWRRSKLGLTMPAQDRDALAAFMAGGLRSNMTIHG